MSYGLPPRPPGARDMRHLLPELHRTQSEQIVDAWEVDGRLQVTYTTTSSAAQEGWIRDHLPLHAGYAVDVGANDGLLLSNTWAAEQRGWTVLCIEANPYYESLLRSRRALVESCAAASASADVVDFWINQQAPPSRSALRKTGPEHDFERVSVQACTLDQLLAKHAFPRLDLVSIDVEQTELDVLQGLDIARWLPQAFIIESLDDEQQQAIQAQLAPHGYRMVLHTEFDWIYTR